MKTLTKEEILRQVYLKYTIRHPEENWQDFDKDSTSIQIGFEAMQSFSDQENARLTAINLKQAELINLYKFISRFSDASRHHDGIIAKIKIIKLESELASLQSGKEADNCIHFDSCQGRDKCLNYFLKIISDKCIGVDCGHYDDKK